MHDRLQQTLRRRRVASEPKQRQRPRQLAAEQIVELVRQYLAGSDMHELAAQWDLHRTTVAAHLRRAGVELRRQGLSDGQLVEGGQLYSQGWSLQRLADRYSCDAETIRQQLKAVGVIMRKPWERGSMTAS